MFVLDHLMFEVTNPKAEYERLDWLFGLPNAWPYSESADYDSVGMNFGAFNVELIRFRRRFGVARPTTSNRLGGVAFRVGDLGAALKTLEARRVPFRIGEDIPAHTTVPLGDDGSITPFLVRYKFDTTGWWGRLRSEYQGSQGGRLGLVGTPVVRLGAELSRYADLLTGVQWGTAGVVLEVESRCPGLQDLEYLGVSIHVL